MSKTKENLNSLAINLIQRVIIIENTGIFTVYLADELIFVEETAPDIKKEKMIAVLSLTKSRIIFLMLGLVRILGVGLSLYHQVWSVTLTKKVLLTPRRQCSVKSASSPCEFTGK